MDGFNGYVGMAMLAAVVLLALVLVAVLMRASGGGSSLPVFPKPVLTRAEIAFYHRLVRVLGGIGGVDVFPQVAMGAIMDAQKGLDQKTRMSVRNRFDRKIIDFVIVDAETRVLLIVELDDSTHETSKDRARDEITAAAGHRTMRIRGRAARDDAEIERMLRAHLSLPSS
jgi:hypothetical protein